MTALARAGWSYALLADGTTITIRPAGPADYGPVRRLHEAMSPGNLYFRFFSMSRAAAEREARRVCREAGPDHRALLGLLGDELVGVASYEAAAGPRAAEIALAVADGMHGRGIATLLLEHLVSLARARGVQVFTAQALPSNSAALRLVGDAGLAVQRRFDKGVVELSMLIPQSAALSEASVYLDAVAGRETHADVASLESLLAPRSVAVVGAGHRPGSIGRMILLNVRDAGFSGALYAVNPHASDIEGIPCVPSVAALPEAPDLVVVAVPAAGVVDVAQECGMRGAGSLVVITLGLTAAQESSLLEASRRGGMRLVGPNCFGVAVPGIGLDATFAVHHPPAGKSGVVVQSGGVGVALLEHFSRLGIGISSFASVGDKLDVSGNDMLMWWEADSTTELAVLHLESVGNPRKFARTARRVSTRVPILTVHAGRSVPGQRAAASHTAAAAAPLIARQALFDQAGIIATTSFGELLDAAALLASQPVPAGSRVCIVSNAGGTGVLVADACVAVGLAVASPGRDTRSSLRDVLPAGSALGGPVETTAAVSPEAFGKALQIAASEDGVDALIALVITTGAADLIPVLTAARLPVPVVAVVLDQPEAVRLLHDGGAGPPVPAYAYPEAAARALSRAIRYGSWRSRPAGTVPEIENLRVADARSIVGSFLARMPGGGWLSAREADDLLRCYEIRTVEFRRADDANAAVDAAAGLGGHVVIKADVPGLLHKTEAGAVELDLRGPDEVRKAMRRLQDRFGGRLSGVFVEPMITGGVETIVGVVQEPVFGPVVVFGLGGVATDVLGDHAARLAPLAGADADDLIRSIRAAPLLLGHGGQPAADLQALRGTLLRVSRLADHLPQVAELDLNPVIARPDGVIAVDARIRITSHHLADPFLRRLPPAPDETT
ncbi:MAG TPA: GNAT family N-acetyltransferase [Streptosporangiaceae bacterium]|nr:GNAT family N-acetyltransferase [Streptosporangiaceae bacterium]